MAPPFFIVIHVEKIEILFLLVKVKERNKNGGRIYGLMLSG